MKDREKRRKWGRNRFAVEHLHRSRDDGMPIAHHPLNSSGSYAGGQTGIFPVSFQGVPIAIMEGSRPRSTSSSPVVYRRRIVLSYFPPFVQLGCRKRPPLHIGQSQTPLSHPKARSANHSANYRMDSELNGDSDALLGSQAPSSEVRQLEISQLDDSHAKSVGQSSHAYRA